jgi:hypothetical protein
MDREYREKFNAEFSEGVYERYAAELTRRIGFDTPFRLAETPVFLPPSLRMQLADASREIVRQISDPDLIGRMKKAIPPRWATPGMDELPSFAQVDFAIVEAPDGSLQPRLIELQGFPSLSMFQTIQLDAWESVLRTIPGLPDRWSCWFDPFHRASFLELARKTICGSHAPEDVILMDIDPPSQKTKPDFEATKMLLGVDALDPRELRKRGDQLFRKDGRRVRRIYNRVVFDELEVKNIDLPFAYADDLDVEWAPHPNWYWTWSKFSLPFLDHPTVPKATFVSDLTVIPPVLGRYVLKPLFSFAGGGVNVDPTREDIERIPRAERANWCIQEKIEYAPVLKAVDGGGVKVEIRMMFFRPEGSNELVLGQNLARLSRGKMLGVDFNKDFTWVGSSIAIWPE